MNDTSLISWRDTRVILSDTCDTAIQAHFLKSSLCFIPFLYTVTIRVSYLLSIIDMLSNKLRELYTLLLSPSLTSLMVLS